MTSKGDWKRGLANPGPGLLPILAIGALLGYLIAGDIFLASVPVLIISFVWGVVAAYLFLQWVELAQLAHSLTADPIPESLAVAEREAVGARRAELHGDQLFIVRVRRLLEAWCAGWDPRQVMDLAAFQSERAKSSMMAETFFALLLLMVAYGMGGNYLLTISGVVLLGITLYARQSLQGKADAYVEGRLLARLPGNIPQTAVTAAELGGILGQSVRDAFKDYIPQPERMASAIQRAIEESSRQVAREMQELHKTLVESLTSLVKTWSNAAKTTTADLRDVEKALSTVVTDLTAGLTTNAERLNQLMVSHTKGLEQVFGSAGTLFRDSLTGTNWAEPLRKLFADHETALKDANKAVAAQLERIVQMSENIEKILHMQKAVETSLRSVSTADEFQQTLAVLRTHIEKSDRLLEEVTKPRVIRLIESEAGVAEG